jgi:hypothetical protein
MAVEFSAADDVRSFDLEQQESRIMLFDRLYRYYIYMYYDQPFTSLNHKNRSCSNRVIVMIVVVILVIVVGS